MQRLSSSFNIIQGAPHRGLLCWGYISFRRSLIIINQFTFLAGLLTILPFTLAQTYYPVCSIPCIYDTTAIAQAGCLSTDGYCLCQSQSFLKEVSCCVHSNCDASDEKGGELLSTRVDL
ncbi:uncharacterized protein K441DRAFT_85689 [Cenococcum geophilum 1.58]|uniref:uncharacterized protein n=1 Tax=Cenococcum geophilum 1.58 TaxID=794803 RepID=UPI00358DF44A|nr:hypothetical protein K441DRAFT_85689 [Cenococcum geophilum 1.58]